MSSKNDGNGFPVASDVFTNVVTKIAKKRNLSEETRGEALDLLMSSDVFYSRRDNFTSATIVSRNGAVHVGAAKRNPIDRDSPLRGRSLALSRAAQAFLEQVHSED